MGSLETDDSIAQRVWNSMKLHVTEDLEYLKSLAITSECKEKIEDTYIEHVSYSVIRKDDSYSFDLQNLCPPRPTAASNNTKHLIEKHMHTKEQEPLRIIYFIMMHQEPLQVIRLISALNTSHDVFLVHIDKKCSQNMTLLMFEYAESHNNIHLMEQHSVVWGGFSLISVQLDGMKYAMQCLKLEFDLFMILSGSDYPLAPTDEIKRFLSQYKGKSLLRKLNKLNARRICAYLEDVYCECDNALYHVGRRQLNEDNDIILYSSSLWATYHRDFVSFIVEDNEDIVSDYIDFFRFSAISDETFFATLLMNSAFCREYVTSDDMEWSSWRLELWPFINTDKRLMPCRHSIHHSNTKGNTGFCGVGPIHIISQYLPVLQSTKALFARKFNAHADANVLDVIDEWRINSKGKPQLLQDHESITIAFNNKQCLTLFTDDGDGSYLDAYQCIPHHIDIMQTFMLTQCTQHVYWTHNGCAQSSKQFGFHNVSSICEIRIKEECLSIIQTKKGIQSGVAIVMRKCLNDGFHQKFTFNDCRIQYANPALNYLKQEDQKLCVALCDDNMPCLKSCNLTETLLRVTHLP